MEWDKDKSVLLGVIMCTVIKNRENKIPTSIIPNTYMNFLCGIKKKTFLTLRLQTKIEHLRVFRHKEYIYKDEGNPSSF